MSLGRTSAGINKAEDAGRMAFSISAWRRCPNQVRQGVAAGISDDGGQLSHVSWLGSPRGNREPAGLAAIVVNHPRGFIFVHT